MKFGVREICDVVLKMKADDWFGKLWLKKGMPVLYFDTLKTSTLEGAATTVYAQGGKGNPRLVAWEGDRTVTFTMEDALISPQSFSVLSGAGLMDATETKPIFVHATQQVAVKGDSIVLENVPALYSDHKEATMYIMPMISGNIDASIPPFAFHVGTASSVVPETAGISVTVEADENDALKKIAGLGALLKKAIDGVTDKDSHELGLNAKYFSETNEDALRDDVVLYVDYYVKAEEGVKQIDIEAGKFGGSYYLEASTLFRDQATGKDHAAEFIIPNCKVQSNFTFTMAPSGDPSTFTFTMDAFPDYTRFDETKKVIAALQIIEDRTVINTDN